MSWSSAPAGPGMSTAAYLTKQGVTYYRIIDKAGDFGGTWYWNRYPGCMCDVESYTYLPLLEEVGYMPTKKYAHAQEIFEYAQMLGRHFDMYPHAIFQTEVTSVVWQEDVERWLVTTSRQDQLSTRFVVICGGVLHKAKLPGIPGIERFAGRSFHTSRWDYAYTGGGPEEPMDKLHDKVVGIVGTGATAVQAVPKLAAAAKHLYVFQRTPSTVSPRNQRATDPEWFREMAAKPGWHEERMANFVLMTTGGNPEVDLVQDGWTEMFKVDVKKEPRDEAEAAELKALDRKLMDAVRTRIADTVKDPATAEALMPWYGVSCKRPCYHDDYLPTFNRDNVTLVDTDGIGVEEITERGIVAGGTEYPLDCIVYATGFDAPSTFYTHRLGFDPVGQGRPFAVRGLGQGCVDVARRLVTRLSQPLHEQSYPGRAAHQHCLRRDQERRAHGVCHQARAGRRRHDRAGRRCRAAVVRVRREHRRRLCGVLRHLHPRLPEQRTRGARRA